MSTFIKLSKRIKEELGFELSNPKRLYPGHWQRSAGAWSWCAEIPNNRSGIGSCFTAKELLLCKKIDILDLSKSGAGIELFPA